MVKRFVCFFFFLHFMHLIQLIFLHTIRRFRKKLSEERANRFEISHFIKKLLHKIPNFPFSWKRQFKLNKTSRLRSELKLSTNSISTYVIPDYQIECVSLAVGYLPHNVGCIKYNLRKVWCDCTK